MKKKMAVFFACIFMSVMLPLSGFCDESAARLKNNPGIKADAKPDNNRQTESIPKKQAINWMKYDQGIKEAKARNLPVYIEFFATWCPPCKMLDQITFQDQGVIKILNDNFISIKVDIDLEKSIATQFGVRPIPHHVIMNRKGELVKVIRGAMPPDMFIENIKDVVK